MTKTRIVLFIILIALIIYVAHNYITSLKDRVVFLENERTSILDVLKRYEHKTTELHEEVLQKNAAIYGLNSQVSELTTENTNLKNDTLKLQDDLNKVTKEKETLEARLTSIDQLKLAINNIKRKLWEERIAAWRMRDIDEGEGGNKGFLVQDGKSTYTPKVKIEVKVPPSNK